MNRWLWSLVQKEATTSAHRIQEESGLVFNQMSECPSVLANQGIVRLLTRSSQEATEDELAAQQALGDHFAPWPPQTTLTVPAQILSVALRLWKISCT